MSLENRSGEEHLISQPQNRSFMVEMAKAIALALPLAATACGGSVETTDEDEPVDAAPIAETCQNIILRQDPDHPIAQMLLRGDHPDAIGCWQISNPCPKPLQVNSAKISKNGTAKLDAFQNYKISKISDQPVLNSLSQTIIFPTGNWEIPPKSAVDFCLEADVSPVTGCEISAKFQINAATDLNITYDGQPVTADNYLNDFPVLGGEDGINCLNLFDAQTSSIPLQTEATIASIITCLYVDASNAGSKDIILKNFTAAVEFEGADGVKGGLLDTTDPANPVANVGPMQIIHSTKDSSLWVGTPEFSIDGDDQHLEYSHTFPNIHLAPLTTHGIDLVVDILDVQELVGSKIRCVFRANPQVTDPSGKPLNEATVGPDQDIVGNWITLTAK